METISVTLRQTGKALAAENGMRLVGGSTQNEGRVEIRCNGQWGTVCDDFWGINDAHVVCRDLGYSSASARYSSAHFGAGSGPIWKDCLVCAGTENSLLQCPRGYWGCHDCGHSEDAGVRCEGDRTGNVDTYNVRSELALTPTVADHGGVLQCQLRSSEQSRTLQVQHAPADNIILIEIVDDEDGQETNGLRITCLVNPSDQPFPPIGTYEIAIDDVIRSSSSSPTVTLDPPPLGCVEISCTGINEIGRTTAAPRTHCVRRCETTSGNPPAANILSIETLDFQATDRTMNLLIICRANRNDQPYPYLNSYAIGIDGTILSNTSSASAILRPRPNRCLNVTCSASNGVGVTSTWERHCPRDLPANDIIVIQIADHENGQEIDGIKITCFVNSRDQPFPPIETYEIAVNDVIESASSSPSVTLETRPSECVEISCTGINDIGRTITTETYCPRNDETGGEPPAADILSIKTSEFLDKDRQMNLLILCRANLSDQSYPYLHSYSIGVDGTILSNASWTSAVLRPRPNRCINITCSATNGVGITSASARHCPRDPPALDIISIKVEEDEDEWGTNLNISCHVDPIDQPFPPIGVFEITADGDILSRSNSSSTIMEDQPNRCIDIICTGINQYGETVSMRNYCPLRAGHAPPANNILSIETQEIEGSQVILVITCHVSLQDQPFPHLHTYTIGVDNTTLPSSSCASALFRPRPGNKCINVTCSGTNGIGWTFTSVEYCPTLGSEKGPIAGLRRGVLQQPSTTYALLVAVFFLSLLTCATVIVKRREISLF
ncbi:uncharacterized protein [Diadema setosum]|uniref:uncharacterized protein n=1 Tax=Diadema setosum TaxID=31175 RepID=UPI003B3AAC2C